MTPYFVVLVGMLALATLAFGAVYPWAYWPLAIISAALGLWGMSVTRGWREGRTRSIGWALGAVGVAIALQLVPLPLAAFQRLSPNGDRFLTQYDLAYSYQPPAWHPLSTAPADTAVALALFAALALLLIGVTAVAGRLPVRRLAAALAILGVIVSVVGVVNRLPETENQRQFVIYGFWHPEQGGHPFAPFVNPNHYAGWMVLVIGLTVGFFSGLVEESWRARGANLRRWLRWLTRPEAGQLALFALCILAMMTAVILTASRSGAAALAVVLFVVAVRAVRRIASLRAKVAAMAVAALILVGAISWVGVGPLVDKYAHAVSDPSTSGRTAVWGDALHIFRDFPVFGAGLGSFGEMMVLYQSGARQAAFTQAHNDYLQVLAEGGLVVGAAALLLVVMLGRAAWYRLGRDADPVVNWIRFGAVAGLVGIAAQSSVEFSLQMPAVAALFVVLVAIAIHRPSDRTHANRV